MTVDWVRVRRAGRDSRALLVWLLIVGCAVFLFAEVVRGRSDKDYADIVQVSALSIAAVVGAVEFARSIRTSRDRLIGEQLGTLYSIQTRFVDDDDVAGLAYRAAKRPEDLTDAEVTQLFALVAMRMSHYESMYLQSRGPIDAVVTGEWPDAVFSFFSRAVVKAYWDSDKATYDQGFQEEMTKRIEERDPDQHCALLRFGDSLRRSPAAGN